jgi:hypothetical protein
MSGNLADKVAAVISYTVTALVVLVAVASYLLFLFNAFWITAPFTAFMVVTCWAMGRTMNGSRP